MVKMVNTRTIGGNAACGIAALNSRGFSGIISGGLGKFKLQRGSMPAIFDRAAVECENLKQLRLRV